MNINEAVQSIPKTKRREWTHFNWGNTTQIMNTIMSVSEKEVVLTQTADFSKYFKASNPQDQIEKLRELWAWVRYNIRYVADSSGIQKIKHPARTYEDRYADCKSMSIFIHSVLYNLNIPHYYAFTSYNKKKRIQHVYVVAQYDGREIPIDTVYEQFDAEEKFTAITKKHPTNMTKIVEIAGNKKTQEQSNIILPKRAHIPYANLTEGEVMLALNVRHYDLISEINKGNGFHQEAGESARFRDEFQRLYAKGLHTTANKYSSKGGQFGANFNQVIQAIEKKDFFSMEGYLRNMTAASIAGPFDPSTVQIEECEAAAMERAIYEASQSGIVLSDMPHGGTLYLDDLAGQLMQPCLDTKKMENVVNKHMEDAGLSFLYDLMGDSDVTYNAAIVVKKLNQGAWIADAARATGLSISVIQGICSNGVLAKGENTPEGFRVRFLPYMVGQGVSVGEPVSAVIIAIASLVSALVSALAAAGLFQRDVKPISKFEGAFNDIINPNNPNFKFAQNDFTNLGEGGGNSSGNNGGNNSGNDGNNPMSNLLTPTNMGLAALGIYFATK